MALYGAATVSASDDRSHDREQSVHSRLCGHELARRHSWARSFGGQTHAA
jgi:hypothetical protein